MIFLRNNSDRTQSRGFTLVEMVLYIGLFVLLSTMSMTALFQTVRAFNELRVSRDIDDSAVKIMERLTRDIKSSTSVDLANSTFGSSPGRLTLLTVNASGTPLTVEYYVSGSILSIRENGVDRGALMSARTNIDALVFYYISSGPTFGIKTELHISSTRGKAGEVDDFYDTSVLRGSY
ncbi:MAG: hypothetical protein A3C14_05340 [Candidatus Lloydbacteria bacterium RIFCSPHIGHO2_02_FULL_50_18]|nr:MAG: hypothetical protein A3C14_05340 [Candidatus Lloydbacteria bacterium RIFCSPHIGHO2_02_FULL_50_18]